jgi:hypothetical protein
MKASTFSEAEATSVIGKNLSWNMFFIGCAFTLQFDTFSILYWGHLFKYFCGFEDALPSCSNQTYLLTKLIKTKKIHKVLFSPVNKGKEKIQI